MMINWPIRHWAAASALLWLVRRRSFHNPLLLAAKNRSMSTTLGGSCRRLVQCTEEYLYTPVVVIGGVTNEYEWCIDWHSRHRACFKELLEMHNLSYIISLPSLLLPSVPPQRCHWPNHGGLLICCDWSSKNIPQSFALQLKIDPGGSSWSVMFLGNQGWLQNIYFTSVASAVSRRIYIYICECESLARASSTSTLKSK